MPKKKIEETVAGVTDTGETVTPEQAINKVAEIVKALSQDSYYVWTAEGQFYKYFTVAEHGADAEKKAKLLADEIGGTVS